MTEASTKRPDAAGPPPRDDVLLDVRNLRTYFRVMDGVVPAVDGVTSRSARARPWASWASRARARA